jgi:3-hydroxybutyryl-CoA dehydrogenase
MSISKVAVLGAGTMGSGIAQVAASSELNVLLIDLSDQALQRGMSGIRKSLDKLAGKGVMTAEQSQAAAARIVPITDLARAAESEIIIEAVFENFNVKRDLIVRLDALCLPATIFASNTSSISITRLAACTGKADRVIGMHFMNPVPLMALVELVRGISTSQETYDATRQLALTMKKTPVEVNDSPGFVSNRVLMPMINEAIFTLYEGVGSQEAIDTVMKLGMNHPMGPLTLADLIGLDVCLDILNVLYEGFKDSKYRPCPLLQKMVDAGYLGRKSGRGFYEYARS